MLAGFGYWFLATIVGTVDVLKTKLLSFLLQVVGG